MSKHNAAPDCAGRNGAQDHGKHTPGPWEYRGDGLYAEGDDYPFLWGWDDGGLVGRSEPVHAANIRLIAAAPDLLEALRAIVEDRYVEKLGSLKLRARTAIAKAEGRSDV